MSKCKCHKCSKDCCQRNKYRSDECHECRNCDRSSECNCTCNGSKTVCLNSCDRKNLAEISVKIGEIGANTKLLNSIPEKIAAVTGAIENASHARSDSEGAILDHINRLIDSQAQQTRAIESVSSRIELIPHAISNQSIQVEMSPTVAADMESISRSLASIHNTQVNVHNTQREMIQFLRTIWPPLLTLAVLSILLPLLARFLTNPHSGTTVAPTPVVIPVPSIIITPTPIPIPVPQLNITPTPVAIPIPIYYTHCPNNDYLCVRQSHSLQAKLVSKIPCNSPSVQIIGATVDSDGETWAPIQYQSPSGQMITGWVVKRFLSQQVS